MKARGLLIGLTAVAAVLAGCDVGSTIEAENHTGQEVLARISVLTCADSVERAGYVVVVPAKTRLFIAQQPFTCPTVERVEVLATDCTPIADFQGIGTGLIVIDDGPRAELQNQQRTGAVTAVRTDACPGPLRPLPATTAPSLSSSR
jgi:hypothetical protein